MTRPIRRRPFAPPRPATTSLSVLSLCAAACAAGCDGGTVVVDRTPGATPAVAGAGDRTPADDRVETRAEPVAPPAGRNAVPKVKQTERSTAGGDVPTHAGGDPPAIAASGSSRPAAEVPAAEMAPEAPPGDDPAANRPARRTRSSARRRSLLKLPELDREAPDLAATLLLSVPPGSLPGADACVLAVVRAEAVPGGVAVPDPAYESDVAPAPRARRTDPADAAADPAAPPVLAVHLHPAADLAALAATLPWLTVTETDEESRTLTAAVDPLALAAEAFPPVGPADGAGGGRVAVVAVTGLAAFDPPPAAGGTAMGARAAAAAHADDAPAAIAAEHLRRAVFAGGPDGNPETPDAPPDPPAAGGWSVRTVHFEGAADSPHYLVAAPVVDAAAFAAGLADHLAGATVPRPPAAAAGDDADEPAGPAAPAPDPGSWAAFLARDSSGDAAGGAAADPAAGSVAVLTATADPAARTALTDPAALPDPCAGDAAAFSHALAARRRARDAALRAGGHDETLWKQGQSSPDRTPAVGEDDLGWSLRVVGAGCEDGAARGEAYGLLAAADPATAPADARGAVVDRLGETLPAAVARRDGEPHLLAMLRWAGDAAGYRAAGEAAAAARTPRIGLFLLERLGEEAARRGAPDPTALHAALPLLTTLGTADAAEKCLAAAGPAAEPAVLTLLDADALPARRAAVNLLDGPPGVATAGSSDALMARAKAEPDRDLARRLRLLAIRLRG